LQKSWSERAKYFESLGAQFRRHQGVAGCISAGPRKARDETDTDGVTHRAEYDWNCAGGSRCGKAGGRPNRYDDIDMLPYQVSGKCVQAFRIPFREFAFNDDILAFQIAEFGELSHERRHEKIISTRVKQPYSDGLFSARCERPRYRRAAEERDECASLHLLPFENGKPSTLRPDSEREKRRRSGP